MPIDNLILIIVFTQFSQYEAVNFKEQKICHDYFEIDILICILHNNLDIQFGLHYQDFTFKKHATNSK